MSLSLTARDIEIVLCLTLQVRVMTVKQSETSTAATAASLLEWSSADGADECSSTSADPSAAGCLDSGRRGARLGGPGTTYPGSLEETGSADNGLLCYGIVGKSIRSSTRPDSSFGRD